MIPLISYITPTQGKRPEFLLEAMKSLLNQTEQNFEWLIITDNDNFKIDNTIDNKTHILKTNLDTVSKKRNIGIQFAKGEFVAFLDDDDIKHPDFGKRMVENIKDPHIGVMCNMDVINEFGKVIGEHIVTTPFLYEHIWGTPSLVWVNELVIKKDKCILFDENIITSEDYDFILCLLKNNQLKVIPNKLCAYRKHSTNLSDDDTVRGEPTHQSIHHILSKHKRNICCPRCGVLII